MALLPILSFPDPVFVPLPSQSKKSDDIRQLAADMFETMYEAPGIGLAATQVDHHIQLIVMDLSEEKKSTDGVHQPQSHSTDSRDTALRRRLSLCLKYTIKLSVRHV